MRHRWLLFVAALAAGYALIAPIVRHYRNKLPASVASSPVTGVWHGMVRQKDLDSTYAIILDLPSAEGGTVRYPALHCGGTVRYDNAVGNVLYYTEHITDGRETRCQDGGTIRLFLGDLPQGLVGFVWTGPGPQVGGTLHKLRPGETLPHETPVRGKGLPLQGIIPY